MAAAAASAVAADDLRGLSSRMSASFREAAGSVFPRDDAGRERDEHELLWAALERLPTRERVLKGVLSREVDGGGVRADEVDVRRLGKEERKILMERVLKAVDEDTEQLLRRLRERIDRVGIELPTIEVRFEDLSVEGDAFVGKRALPTLFNATLNILEGMLPVSVSKEKINILKGVSGIIRPSRMTLLLGPPGSGKTTLLLALAGKLDKNLRVSGKITYCGHDLLEFIPQRTSAYISQLDLHNPEMTVRETLNFSGRCLGVGTKYDMLLELLRREKDAGIKPDPDIDAFMKATSFEGQDTNLVSDYIIKILGLDICADVVIGNEMLRGISGGQKKRVTIGEMLVGPAKALFMDEISTGLDSSTTFQIVKYLKQMVRIMDETIVISLLQPAPETFDLFDDIILLSEGQIVYQGPRENILEFFELMGFRCPERKGVADFLQEVTSKKDQEQYWSNASQPYKYISVTEFAKSFNSFYGGQCLIDNLRIPYNKPSVHPAALETERYGISKWELFKACFSREWLLMKRNSFVLIFVAVKGIILATIATTLFLRTEMHHETIGGGGKYLGALFFGLLNMMFNGVMELPMTVSRLPVFYKQRDYLFYPPWAFGLPICLLKIPVSLLESVLWVCITYYGIGFAPAASRFFKQFLAFFCSHQMAFALFRFIASVGRTPVVSSTFGSFGLLLMFVLGGFVIAKEDIQSWWQWGYWISPMMYAQNAIAVNEFLDPRWNIPNNDTSINAPTIGKALLKSRSLEQNDYWYWISIGALVGFTLLFNVWFIAALTYLDPFGGSKPMLKEDTEEKEPPLKVNGKSRTSAVSTAPTPPSFPGIQMEMSLGRSASKNIGAVEHEQRAMILPFKPLSLSFKHINYFVDMPPEMKSHGIKESRLQLLQGVSGAFRPGVLTALVGVSGAGKTTLMDVLAGRKTGGYIEGAINISGYPKNQATFARVTGYCEQNDIHSPYVTVYESLIYSAWLRLSPDIEAKERKMFVEEVINLVELNKLKDAIVGLPGVDGLSTEQRKRLTIAVELVANPSIIFMDEPTSGLDARAAAIVMRTVRNTVNTGRTVVCTIHQPSIDIFEAFDELLLMKRGGQVIYAGPLGDYSCKLIEYFEAIPGIPKIKDGYNPATWMLEISSNSVEARLNLDFAEIYYNSSLYQKNQKLIDELSTPATGTADLYFTTKYSQSILSQCAACFWKQYWSYWRNPGYNVVRYFMTVVFGFLFGSVFWNRGKEMHKQQDVLNLLGAMYSAVLFLGASNTSAVKSVVFVERIVFYRERAAGMYSAIPYAFAQVSIEVLYVAAQSIIYSVILFFMLGFGWNAARFCWFLYLIFMCFLYFTMGGMMLASLTPDPQVAAVLMAFPLSMWNLFSGFLIPKTAMPIWWRWCYWTSPVAWTLYGIVESQVGDKEGLVAVPGEESIPIAVFLKLSFGYQYSFLKYIALAHVGIVLIFLFVFTYSIKFINFQRR